ncbi:MAG: tyrosine-type recombinase/integrase, partial [Planctomycetota bacterium]
MPKFNFTLRRLSGLEAPEKGRIDYRDDKVPGLAIRVTSAGAMSAYILKKVRGRHLKLRLGKWPDDFKTVRALRDAATAALGDLEGLTTRRRRARHEPTVADLWAVWETHMQAHKKPSSQTEDRRLWERHLAKRWGKRRLSDITRQAVAALHARVGRNAPYEANRLRSLISAMWNEGRRAGLVSVENPTRDIRRYREEKRDRWLDADELRQFFQALHEEPDELFRDYFVLCLLTGARRGNMLSMRWEDIDLRRGLWRIPDTKAGVPQVVPLAQPAVAILERRKLTANGNEWVFPGRKAGTHLQEPAPAWRRIIKRAKLKGVRPHDLRRSLGSWMATRGVSLPTIGKTLFF